EPHAAVAVVVEQIELGVEEQATADAAAGDAEIELGRRPEAGIEDQLCRVRTVAVVARGRVIVNEEAVEEQERVAEAAVREISHTSRSVAEGKVDIQRGLEIDRDAERPEDREERRELAVKLERRHVIGQQRHVLTHQQTENAGGVIQDVELERLSSFAVDTGRTRCLLKPAQDLASDACDFVQDSRGKIPQQIPNGAARLEQTAGLTYSELSGAKIQGGELRGVGGQRGVECIQRILDRLSVLGLV